MMVQLDQQSYYHWSPQMYLRIFDDVALAETDGMSEASDSVAPDSSSNDPKEIFLVLITKNQESTRQISLKQMAIMFTC